MSSLAMPDAASRLLRRYYVLSGLYTLAASIIWGVNTLFLLDAGLSIAQVFLANSAFSAGMLIFEIPTGVVADTLGRRVSFLVSVAILLVTTLAYVGLAQIGSGLAGYMVVSALIGVGFTFYSGAVEAWLVDGLHHTGYHGELDRIFGRGHIISGGAMLVGTVGGGLLGQIDLAIPFLTRSALLAVLFLIAARVMHDLGFEPRAVRVSEVPREAMRVARAGVSFGWGHRSLRLLIAGTALQSGFFSWAWYAWQPYFLELLRGDAVWVAGVVAALLALSMMVGNSLVSVITRWCGRRTTAFLWVAAVFSLACIGVGVVDEFVPALVFLLVATIATGVQTPVRQAFVHQVVPTDQRATVVSFDSMISGAAGVAAQPTLGALADRRGFSAGYVVGGLATLVALPVMAVLRRRQDDADLFVGVEAEQACPTPSIPAISLVDGEPRLEPV